MMSPLPKIITQSIFSAMLFSISHLSHALPFSVLPSSATSLPTQMLTGQTTNAFYTITNNTSSVRANNYIKYLPPNVTQITSNSGIANLCGATFTLQPKNAVGSSCTLELLIANAVDGSDKEPSHNIFACFPGGTSCAGTPLPLNVSLFPAPGEFVAAGVYFDTSLNPYIGLATSKNNGTSWVQQSLTAPAGYSEGQLNGMSCTGNACAGAGYYYQDANGAAYATIALSTNQGVSWTQQILPPVSGFNYRYLNGIYCLSNACIAVGTYRSTSNFGYYSAIVTSNNSGATWSQQILPWPSGVTYASLNAVNCTGNTCVAVGEYDTNVSQSGVAVSNDAGQTWSQQVLPLPPSYTNAYLNGVACTGSACIAVGDYSDSNYYDHLALAISTNNGSTWSQQILTPPSQFTTGSFNGISCTGSYCVAVGSYTVNDHYDMYPAIAVTTNSGVTWSQQVLSIPSGFTYGILTSVNCTTNTCVAAGYYTNDEDVLPSPFVAVSTNSGNTWSQQTLSPSFLGYTYGQFYGIG